MIRRWKIKGLYVFLLGLGLWFLWALFVGSWVERLRFYEFDKEQWASVPVENRYYMAQYLIDQDALLGKSHEEVTEMLGATEVGNETFRRYNLGPERGSLFVVDNDWLTISFGGPDSTVSEVRIIPD